MKPHGFANQAAKELEGNGYILLTEEVVEDTGIIQKIQNVWTPSEVWRVYIQKMDIQTTSVKLVLFNGTIYHGRLDSAQAGDDSKAVEF